MLFDQAYARPRPHMRQLFVDSIEEEVGEGQAMPYGGEGWGEGGRSWLPTLRLHMTPPTVGGGLERLRH